MYDNSKSPGRKAGNSPDPESLQYWKATSGHVYREMIRTREGQGNRAYGQQEKLLTALIQAEQQRLDRPLEVLEFGCGFGRHASYIASLPHVRYHGYDFSEAMLEPLRASPPPAMSPLSERLFSGENPLAAVNGRQFDLVFTVSVMIHNPTERIPGLLETMGQLVRPEGLLLLVENQLVPFGVWDNAWHEGCWLHAYPDALPEGWDLHHGPGLIDTHDAYLLKRNGGQGRRYFHFAGPEHARDESQALTLEALHTRALPRLRTWASQAEHALNHVSSHDARVAELSERVSVETERFARRQRLFALTDDLARLRSRRAPTLDSPPPPVVTQTPHLLFDDAFDTTWAHSDPRFGRVLHVFHQEWHGIRAAAGYFPGHKLAITAERPMGAAELKQAVEKVADSLCHTLIVHGYSSHAHEFMVAVRKVLGSSVRIVSLWHGSSAQFHYSFELESVVQLLELHRRKVIDRIATVKPGMHLLSEEVFPKTILNLPPKMEGVPTRAGWAASRTALIPTPNDWRKNFYTNLFACTASPRLDDVYVTAQFTMPPQLKPHKRIHRVVRPHRTELFELVRKSDLVLNASLSECQPMTALEALALGVPCITGPLSLGTLDGHPYQRLAQVAGVDSISAVEAGIERILSLQEKAPQEFTQMMADYAQCLKSEALQILEAFLQ